MITININFRNNLQNKTYKIIIKYNQENQLLNQKSMITKIIKHIKKKKIKRNVKMVEILTVKLIYQAKNKLI